MEKKFHFWNYATEIKFNFAFEIKLDILKENIEFHL